MLAGYAALGGYKGIQISKYWRGWLRKFPILLVLAGCAALGGYKSIENSKHWRQWRVGGKRFDPEKI